VNGAASLPERWYEAAGRVEVVEAQPGLRRRAWLQDRLREAACRGARTWLLPCRFDDGGPWAGVRELFAAWSVEIGASRPQLLKRHDDELIHVLPELRRSLEVRYPTLTDLAPADERVRSHPADRVLRVVHGLVDLLVEAGGREDRAWVIACDGLDVSGQVGRRFFQELMRRRGSRLRIVLTAAVDPGHGEEVRGWFGSLAYKQARAVDLTPGAAEPLDRAAAMDAAEQLEARAAGDDLEAEIHLAEMIRLWRTAGRPDKAAYWQLRGLEICAARGLYADAVRYGEAARAFYQAYAQVSEELRWWWFSKLFMAYVAVGRADEAQRLAEEDAIGKLGDPERCARLSYLLAMLHSRYLPRPDLARGDDLLAQGRRTLGGADLADEDRRFQSVLNRNGLAMIRSLQGRLGEAMVLCRQSHDELEAHLDPARHRLQRSVLLYNLGQVYSALGRWEDAARYLTLALELDPNYSEYYNDRGNAFLKMGRLREAHADYLRAIELSPPYPEVHVNLGQCYRAMGELGAAIDAYSRALDLDPTQELALAGRAHCLDALGRTAAALADYDAALALRPDQWDVLANRAAVLFARGNVAASLADLDGAIALAPEAADLYRNRSLALAELGRTVESALDLETFLELRPGCEDRIEMAAFLAHLRRDMAPAPFAAAAALLGA